MSICHVTAPWVGGQVWLHWEPLAQALMRLLGASASKVTHVVDGRIQFLVRCWLKTSVPHWSLARGLSIGQTTTLQLSLLRVSNRARRSSQDEAIVFL